MPATTDRVNATAIVKMLGRGLLVRGSDLPEPAKPEPDLTDAELEAFRRDADAAAYEEWVLSKGEEEFARWKEYVESLPTAEEIAAEAARLGVELPY